jgi:hypothetical protein
MPKRSDFPELCGHRRRCIGWLHPINSRRVRLLSTNWPWFAKPIKLEDPGESPLSGRSRGIQHGQVNEADKMFKRTAGCMRRTGKNFNTGRFMGSSREYRPVQFIVGIGVEEIG